MANLSSITLGDLIEATLNILYRAVERPAVIEVGAEALEGEFDTQFTLVSGDELKLSTPMVVEFGHELMLITGKSSDATPVFTAIRKYAGTPSAGAVPTGSKLLLEPAWSRRKVRDSVVRAFARTLNAKLPAISTMQISPESGKAVVEMPAYTIDVLRVFYVDPVTGAPSDLDGWDFFDDMSSASATGKMLRLDRRVSYLRDSDSNLYVTLQVPYRWAPAAGGDLQLEPSSETDTISVPLGAEDLAPKFAAAYVVGDREVSRIQIDRSEEWPNEGAIRNGLNMRQIQQLWVDFYRALDEARSIQNVPRRLRYRPRRKL